MAETNQTSDGSEELREYWIERLDKFEREIYPIFHERGYSKNTALTTYMLDELDTAVMLSLSARP